MISEKSDVQADLIDTLFGFESSVILYDRLPLKAIQDMIQKTAHLEQTLKGGSLDLEVLVHLSRQLLLRIHTHSAPYIPEVQSLLLTTVDVIRQVVIGQKYLVSIHQDAFDPELRELCSSTESLIELFDRMEFPERSFQVTAKSGEDGTNISRRDLGLLLQDMESLGKYTLTESWQESSNPQRSLEVISVQSHAWLESRFPRYRWSPLVKRESGVALSDSLSIYAESYRIVWEEAQQLNLPALSPLKIALTNFGKKILSDLEKSDCVNLDKLGEKIAEDAGLERTSIVVPEHIRAFPVSEEKANHFRLNFYLPWLKSTQPDCSFELSVISLLGQSWLALLKKSRPVETSVQIKGEMAYFFGLKDDTFGVAATLENGALPAPLLEVGMSANTQVISKASFSGYEHFEPGRLIKADDDVYQYPLKDGRTVSILNHSEHVGSGRPDQELLPQEQVFDKAQFIVFADDGVSFWAVLSDRRPVPCLGYKVQMDQYVPPLRNVWQTELGRICGEYGPVYEVNYELPTVSSSLNISSMTSLRIQCDAGWLLVDGKLVAGVSAACSTFFVGQSGDRQEYVLYRGRAFRRITGKKVKKRSGLSVLLEANGCFISLFAAQAFRSDLSVLDCTQALTGDAEMSTLIDNEIHKVIDSQAVQKLCLSADSLFGKE